MATIHTLVKSFEDWKGLHKGFSNISRPAGFSDVARNILLDKNFDLTQRPGSKVIAGSSTADLGDYRGLFNYPFFTKGTSQINEDLIAFPGDGASVHKLSSETEGTFTITYTGVNSAEFRFFPVADFWEADLIENGVSVAGFPKQYGTGLAELGFNLLDDLIADITAVADFTATVFASDLLAAGGDTLPAAVLPVTPSLDLSGGSGVLKFPRFEVVNSAGSGFEFNVSDTDIDAAEASAGFVNVSAVTSSNSLFFAPYGDYVFKYDGQNTYRSGLPIPSFAPTLSNITSGPLTGKYEYAIAYIQEDNNGKIYEGPLSERSTTNPSSEYVAVVMPTVQAGTRVGTLVIDTATNVLDITTSSFPDLVKTGDTVGFVDMSVGVAGSWTERKVTNVVRDGISSSFTIDGDPVDVDSSVTNIHITTGEGRCKFNIKSAVIAASAGDQTDVNTITVLSGHTLQVGDKAYFFEIKANTYITRNITAITATSITIDGASISVSASTPAEISNNLKIAIYRTKADNTDLFLVAEVPNRNSSTQITFDDTVPDSELGPKYVPPVRIPNPSPKAKFLTAHQGLVVAAGDPENPNTVYFNEPGNSEAWPAFENNFVVGFQGEGVITGLGVDNDILIVFKENARAYVYGDLAGNTFTVQIIEDGIGCPGHHSIAVTPLGLIFLSQQGFQRSQNGQLDPDTNSRLALDFKDQFYTQFNGTTISTADESKLVVSRATSINHPRLGVYICYVPCESGDVGVESASGNERYPNTNSKAYQYDYKNDIWSEITHGEFTLGGIENIMNAYGGMALHRQCMYFAGTFGRSGLTQRTGMIFQEQDRSDIYVAADNTLPIDCAVSTEWLVGDSPSTFKKFLRHKTWVGDPSLMVGTAEVTIESFRNFSSTRHSFYTRTFTDVWFSYKTKLRLAKSRALKLEYSNNILHEAFRLTGYEVEVSGGFSEQIKE